MLAKANYVRDVKFTKGTISTFV